MVKESFSQATFLFMPDIVSKAAFCKWRIVILLVDDTSQIMLLSSFSLPIIQHLMDDL